MDVKENVTQQGTDAPASPDAGANALQPQAPAQGAGTTPPRPQPGAAPNAGVQTTGTQSGGSSGSTNTGSQSTQGASPNVASSTSVAGAVTRAGAKGAMMIGEKLVERGLISPDQLQVALKTQKQSPGGSAMLGSILIKHGFITESALGEVLAESTGVMKFDPKTTVLDPNLIKQLPKETAARHKVVPVLLDGETIYLAMVDIYNVLAIDQVQRHFPKNYKIVPVFCSEPEILEIIDQYYDYEMSVDGILREIETGVSDTKKLTDNTQGYVNPTVRLVDSILVDAIKRGTSDIHFEPEDSFLRLRYRIDGKMTQIRSFHKDYWPAIVVRIKILSGMNIAETRLPQDGRITYNVLGREVDFRVATQPTIHGENIVLRILDKKKSLVSLDKLGFSAHNEAILRKLLKRPEGIIVVTGPTGSGKTTSLYAVLSELNKVDVNIMTLENPVEFQLPMIRQSNIRQGSGMGFAEGIKSLMRQDPDIIFVGEVRDKETAEMALRAAMTGHQVYSTLHTNDAVGAIPRLIDIGLEPRLLSGAIIGIVAQRLARKLCSECKEIRHASPEDCRIMQIDPANPPELAYHVGCEKCSYTGYKGRVGIVEVLPVDRQIDELIAVNATRKQLFDYAIAQGFKTTIDDGILKVLAQITDLDELIDTIDMTERL